MFYKLRLKIPLHACFQASQTMKHMLKNWTDYNILRCTCSHNEITQEAKLYGPICRKYTKKKSNLFIKKRTADMDYIYV